MDLPIAVTFTLLWHVVPVYTPVCGIQVSVTNCPEMKAGETTIAIETSCGYHSRINVHFEATFLGGFVSSVIALFKMLIAINF